MVSSRLGEIIVSLRQGYWMHDAAAVFEDQRVPVAYKHHIRREEINRGEWFNLIDYKAWEQKSEPDHLAWEWGMDFKLSADRSKRVIIAHATWEHALLYDIVYSACYGSRLSLVLADRPAEMIRLSRDSHWYRPVWTPYAYAENDSNGDLAALHRIG